MNKISIVTFVGYISFILSLYPHKLDKPQKKIRKTHNCAVTYNTKHVGRFGDYLIMITKAAWVAKNYNLPLIYRPFKYSNMLAISTEKKSLLDFPCNTFTSQPIIKTSQNLLSTRTQPTLYTIHFHFKHPKKKFIDSNNTALRETMRSLLRPIIPLQFPAVPQQRHAVAVHIRKGGGFDRPLASGLDHIDDTIVYADKKYPRKFPPDTFYIGQLKYLSSLLNHEPMHVRIFTDDPNPAEIAQKLKNELNMSTIDFSWRTKDNHHDANVLYDFFHMSTFDYLIRPQSSFSKMAEFIGDFKLVIHPRTVVWKGNTLHIPKVSLTYFDENEKRYVIDAVSVINQ